MIPYEEAFRLAALSLAAETGGPSLDVVYDKSSAAYAIAAGIARVGLMVSAEAESRFADTFLDSAQAQALYRLGDDRYQVQRPGATGSSCVVSFSRAAALTTQVLEAETPFASAEGPVFKLREDVVLLVGDLGPTDGVADSVDAGRDTVVAANSLHFQDTAPTGVTMTNAASSGGNDAMPPEEYKAYVRTAWRAAIGATVEAIERGAKTVAQVRRASVYETLGPDGHELGEVVVAVADEAGGGDAAMETAVLVALRAYRGAGIRAFAMGAVVVEVDIMVSTGWLAGYANETSKAAARARIIAAVNQLEPNPTGSADTAPGQCILDPSSILAALVSTPGAVASQCSVVLPAARVVPGSGEVLRAGSVKVT